MANQTSGKIFWKQDRWNGGQSEDSRIGEDGAGRFLIGNDIQNDSGLLGVARRSTRHDSASTFTDLIKWMVENPATGDIYNYAGNKIVKESAGSYSANHTVPSDTTAGQGLGHFNTKLYAFSSTKIHKYDYTTWTDNWQTGLTAADWHPTCNILNLMLFGHGRYVGTIDDVGTVTLARLTLPPEYVVRHIFLAGTYAAILATKGSSILGSDAGMLFLWNGSSQNYDTYIPLDGNPHAGVSVKNVLTIIAGSEPSIQESLGGMAEIKKVIPNIGIGKTAEVWPGAIDVYRRTAYFGISDGTSTDVLRVLHAWGAKNSRFSAALNPQYPTSQSSVANGTNLTGTSVQITAVKRVGNTLRFAWKVGSDYGIDYIDMTAFSTEAVFRTLAFDNQSPYEKTANKLKVELAGNLAVDEYVILKISGDPYGDPTFAGSIVSRTVSYDAANPTNTIELPLTAESVQVRSRDLHVEIRRGGTGSTRPQVKRMWLDFDEDQDQI